MASQDATIAVLEKLAEILEERSRELDKSSIRASMDTSSPRRLLADPSPSTAFPVKFDDVMLSDLRSRGCADVDISVGSYLCLANTAACRPCVDSRRSKGCVRGFECNQCHFHRVFAKNNPSQKQRRRRRQYAVNPAPICGEVLCDLSSSLDSDFTSVLSGWFEGAQSDATQSSLDDPDEVAGGSVISHFKERVEHEWV